MKLEKGIQVMALHFLTPEGINIDYLEFVLKANEPASPAVKKGK